MTASTALLVACFALGQQGLIAFITGPTQEEYRLTVLNLDDGRLSSPGAGKGDAFPRWSPDGRRIAYQSRREDGTGIRIAEPLDGQDKGLEHRFPINDKPSWSPDGGKLAYTSGSGEDPLQCIVVQTLDTGQEDIWGGEQRGFLDPVWLSTTDLMKAMNPEDQDTAEALGLLQMKQEAEEGGVITAVGISGAPPRLTTDLFAVTRSMSVPLLALLSPDGGRYVKYRVTPDHKAHQIAYESNEGGDREVFVLGRRGIINVSNHHAADWNPVWSPDDDWMAFESFRGGRRGIYRLLASTGNTSPVFTGENFDCWAPDWSPDGEWIVCVSDMTGTPQLYVVRPDGSELKQITRGEAPALAPAWQPKVKESRE